MAQDNQLKELAQAIDRVAWALALLAEEYELQAMRLRRNVGSIHII